ncbi:2,5-diketo-D-gluconic acid reductase A [Phialemonium atrogriseum]|uniref:2,5-diketo-D-gluconic acid reductase A n=1 Tax=Phialemonium atrogriseum TaxID=1093897 RepID=A0AAJ0BSS2_9PEZI|nr:2,5-diketo-D-gluconic acid reductase A [Phialemonium atrogriseum]KAK1763823.1 2,5-diketo-D-gluconic acid reductase A [Phialemonium atrogriseum]
MAPSAISPTIAPQHPILAKKIVTDARERASSVSNPNPTVELNDGNLIPQVALGVYKAPNGQETEDAVIAALDAGYRHIDSAARYANEEACGRAIRRWLKANNVSRKDIYVTTKLWDADHGYEATFNALCDSLDKFGLDYFDLYLIHSPSSCEQKRLESWRALEVAKKLGIVRSIGVSNFGASHIQHLLDNATVVPAVNQIEVHPFCQRQDLVDLCGKFGIRIEAYSPLARGDKLEDPTIRKIAEKHDRSPAQILLNWSASRGNVVLPKSLTAHRIESNFRIFDFVLDDDDVALIDALGAENYVTGSLHKSD